MPHIHTKDGQYDFTVAGYLIHKNTTLLIKHKYLPIWTPPAGHIELNQTPIEALFMEVEEEAGIKPSQLTLVETSPLGIDRGESVGLPIPFDIEHHAITDTHRHINLAYILLSDTNHVEPGAGESNTFKWFSAEELRNFNDTNKSILNAALYALEYTSKTST